MSVLAYLLIFSCICSNFLLANSQSYNNYDYFGPYLLNSPNNEVYQQIYQDAVNEELPIIDADTANTNPDTGEPENLSEMYLELFQAPRNRRNFGFGFGNNNNNAKSSPQSPLDRCASQVRLSRTTLRKVSTPTNQFFYGINPGHSDAMHGVKQVLMQTQTPRETICTARALRDRPEVNRHAWLRGVISASMNRRDMRFLPRPPIYQVTPSLMIPNPNIQQARNQAKDTCALVDGSVGRENGRENRLWYWREDILLNTHHLYWHLSNPFSFQRLQVPRTTKPDRRGELFYYVHHSMLARYHAERLANGLPPVVPLFINRGTVIPEQYYAYLTDANSARTWTDRPPNTPLQSLVSNRDFIEHPANISITDRLELMRRIEESIRTRTLRDRNGRAVRLDPFNGIDLLGELVEASIYSINPDYYGEFGMHNEGHFLIGLIADPLDANQIPPSVMADGATAMRDPAFYTYHTPIDKLFDQFKRGLPPYQPIGGDFPLSWPGIEIQGLQVLTQEKNSVQQGPPNVLKTYWNYAEIDLTRGLDFNRSDSNGSVMICMQHLDNVPFSYQLVINRNAHFPSGSGGSAFQRASVRIFMAPRLDGNGRRYTMAEQRDLFFVLDYFQVELRAGQNPITRKSVDSTLTIPWPQTIEELERDSGTRLTPYCGCGWPEHLLIPKGTAQGMIYDLFVMVTNGNEDAVAQKQPRRSTSGPNCKPSPLYCGIMDQLYPDSKPMGYPFDRLPHTNGGGYLEQYMQGITNMFATQVLIVHDDDAPRPETVRPNQYQSIGYPGSNSQPVNFGNSGRSRGFGK